MSTPKVMASVAALGVSIATAILMLATEPRMAIVWDEGYTLGREARLRDWFRGLRDPVRFAKTWRPLPLSEELLQQDDTKPPGRDKLDTRSKLLFDHDVLAWFWPFAREEPHGHPPFYALIGLFGDVLGPSWSDLARARLGPILLFSLTAGVIFRFAAARWSGWAAASSAGAWILQPNLFGHGHYAGYDGVLTSLWVLAVIVFAQIVAPQCTALPARSRWCRTMAFGLVLGCAAGTKFTGWFLALPFLVWAGLYRSRDGFKTVIVGLLIAVLVMLTLMPPWWTDPINGVLRFLHSNLNRAETIPIKVLFLGTTYETPAQSLPWYNTLVWTLFVTPVTFLVLAVLGIWAAMKYCRCESIGVLIAGQWSFLMLLRALPHTPGHDGVRLFLPAFGMLALLTGRGAQLLLDHWDKWAKGIIITALLEGTASILVMMPVPLSYFSPLVGGLPGATALGMEPTYYWDALTPQARRWLARNIYPGETYTFSGFPHSWLYLRRTGELPRRLAPIDHGKLRWLVLQNRPGAFSNGDRSLVAKGRAAFTATKLGVPLIWIFPFSELERVNASRGS
jgi:4-amino-4-deoxy-L-arabinose transferase-like glycosyltransferase